MKKIFIYYSLSGNGDIIAKYLSEKGIDIYPVIPNETLPKNQILRILTGGFLAAKEYTPTLKDFNLDISKYDEIIIGSPIWNGRLSCPINTVLKTLNLDKQKLTFILYSGSGKAPKTEKKLQTTYQNIKIINLQEPQKYPENLKLLKDI